MNLTDLVNYPKTLNSIGMDDLDDFVKTSKVYFLDTNLNSPVLTTEFDDAERLFKLYYDWRTGKQSFYDLSPKVREALTSLKGLAEVNKWKGSYLNGLDQLTAYHYKRVESQFLLSESLDDTGFCYDEAYQLCVSIESALCNGLDKRGIPSSEVSGTSEALKMSPCQNYRNSYEQFSNLFGRAESRIKNSEYKWTKGVIGSVEVWISSQYGLLRLDGVLYKSTLNQILMLKDKLSTRYMMLQHVIPLALPSTLLLRLPELFSWQDETLERYGNEAYNILKAIEPMYKTRISHLVDNVFGEDTAYTRMQDKMKSKEKQMTKDASSKMMDKLCSIVEKSTDTQELVELFGCLKSCGHPTVDPARGGLSAAAEARSPDKTSLVDAQTLRNTFCHIILTTHIEKKGIWPRLKFNEPGTTLQTLSFRAERNISYRSYPLSDWNHVKWEKFLEMDYYPNFLELMDDKSISLYRDEKHMSWDHFVSKKPRSQRRLLLEILGRESFDVEALVKQISDRDIPFAWFIVSLYPKEREFKLDPRMFSMLVIEMRCFFTCIEANIAERLFKFMPQQTMTKSKTQIQERMLSFTDPKRSSSTWNLFLEVDLTRWNLKWREMVVHMIGHDMNDMFGVKGTFTVTHWFFKMCQIVVRVGGLRPDGIELDYPPETALAWRGHVGGFEGINQKTWTAATYAMMEMALHDVLMDETIQSYELIGQGDNQVIRLEIKKTDEPREILLPRVRDRINALLTDTCRKVNQEVKPEENIESTSVLTYSKDVYVLGVEYPTSLKKHSRLFPVTSMDFPSTSANASAIMAGAVAASENSRHPLRSSIIGWYHTCRYLIATRKGFSIHGKQIPKLSGDHIVAALMLPPSIGGYIGTPIASFLYKGGSDPLGKEISSIRLFADSDSKVGRICSSALRALEEKYFIDQEPNLHVLIDNPYGLPIDKRAAPVSQVSRLTLEAFKSKVKNVDIKPLLEPQTVTAETMLKDDIISIRPLNPILAHDLFDCSGFGTVKTMRKMFLTTRTIQSVAQWVNPNITHVFLESDRNEIEWFRQWVTGFPKRGYSGHDSFKLVSKFRNYWGIELHGVTNYQPLDFFHSNCTSRSNSSIKWSSHSQDDLFTTRGPLAGYIGTATREKRSEHGYKIADKGASTRALSKLQLIRSQADGNAHFNTLIDRIGLTRTNCVLSTITDLLDHVVGGSIHHRYSSLIRMMKASFVGPLNFVTHIRIDTDTIGIISGSAFNFPIMIQEFMVYTMACAKIAYSRLGHNHGELLLSFDDLIPLPEDTMICTQPLFVSAQLPRTKLLYTPDISLIRTYDSAAIKIPRGSIASVSDYGSVEYVMHAYVGSLVELLRDSHNAKKLADTRGLASIPARHRLDIAEAHALGFTRLVTGCAEAIILVFLRDAYRTLCNHPDRWDESLFLDFQIRACYKVIGHYLLHPLFSTHPDSKTIINSRLRYSSRVSLESQFKGKVRKHMAVIYNTPDHLFWHSKVPCFSGTKSTSLTEALSMSIAKSIMRYHIIGHPDALEYSKLYTSLTTFRQKTDTKIDGQLEMLRIRSDQLSRIIAKMSNMILSKRIRDCSHLTYVVVFNDDSKTILRYARQLDVIKGDLRGLRVFKKTDNLCQAPTFCHSCSPSGTDKYTELWNTHYVRRHGGYSSAGYTWAPMLRQAWIGKTCLIIGSGNGGLADLLITCFGCNIIGIDLESDMPRESATLLNYLPSGIQPIHRDKYVQSDLSINSSGDWYDDTVRHQIMAEAPEGCTLFVDITVEMTDEMVLKTLDQFALSHVVALYMRVIIDAARLPEIMKLIRSIDSDATYWLLSKTYTSCTFISGITKLSKQPMHICTSTPKHMYKYVDETTHSVIPWRYNELLTTVSHSVIGWNLETKNQAEIVLATLCRSLLNKPRQRQLRYNDRIPIIEAYSVFYAANADNPATTIQSWIADELIITDLFTFAVKESIITHLIRSVSRLASQPLDPEAYAILDSQ